MMMKKNKKGGKEMKKYIYISMALAATMFTACGSDDVLDNIENGTATDNKEQPITIVANLPQKTGTRVSYTDDSEGTTYILTPAWATGDKVRYDYRTSTEEKKRTVSVTITDGIGTFNLSDGDPAASSYIYCHHPASANYFTSLAANTSTCVVTPPTNAGFIAASLAEVSGYNYLVGSLQYSDTKSNLNMEFKNVYALLKFNIYIPYEKNTEYAVSRFTSITLKGFDGTSATNVSINGKVTITGSTGEIVWSDKEAGQYTRSANMALTSDISSKSGYRLGVLYVLVTPQTWNGLYLSATDNANQVDSSYSNHTYVYTKTGNISLEAGKMYGINITLKKTMIQTP